MRRSPLRSPLPPSIMRYLIVGVRGMGDLGGRGLAGAEGNPPRAFCGLFFLINAHGELRIT